MVLYSAGKSQEHRSGDWEIQTHAHLPNPRTPRLTGVPSSQVSDKTSQGQRQTSPLRLAKSVRAGFHHSNSLPNKFKNPGAERVSKRTREGAMGVDQKWRPGKWKQGPTPAGPWWLNFDSYPNIHTFQHKGQQSDKKRPNQ